MKIEVIESRRVRVVAVARVGEDAIADYADLAEPGRTYRGAVIGDYYASGLVVGSERTIERRPVFPRERDGPSRWDLLDLPPDGGPSPPAPVDDPDSWS